MLNRPDRLNVLTTAITDELLAAIEQCALDDRVRCLVLTGAGRAFSTGQDYEAQVQDLAIRTADHREGVAAFLQKRQPRFEGK